MKLGKYRFGFTLVELLVTISVIGILATVVIISFGSATAKSRDSKRMSDLDTIASALEMYKYDKHKYPPVAHTANDNNNACWDYLYVNQVSALSGELAEYLPVVPSDPKPVTDPNKIGKGKGTYCAVYNYVYGSPDWYEGSTKAYRMETALEKDHGGKINTLTSDQVADSSGRYLYIKNGPEK